MDNAARATRVELLVQEYLRQGGAAPDLVDYLSTVEAEVREEVEIRCRDAAFIGEFFAKLPPMRALPPIPKEIGGCELGDLLGEGAMGKVFRATQTALARDVAVKLVRVDDGRHEDVLSRLREESRVLAGLDHPGIVKVLFCGETDGWLYFVMELVRGRSLAEALPSLLRREGQGGPHGFDRAARIVAEVLEALAYAHRLGIVHRDLKPSNVVLDADEHPKLVDFGLAKHATSPHRTLPGQLVGTPAFMSPEVVAHRAHDRFSPDVWAAGVMLFQLLTGRLPYSGQSTDEVLQQLLRPIPQDPRRVIDDVPKAIAEICKRALSPDPANRYPSAAAFAADLRRFLAGEPIDRAHMTPWSVIQRHVWRHRRAYAASAALAAVAATAWLGAEAHADHHRATEDLASTALTSDIQQVSARDLVSKAETARRLGEDCALGAEQQAEARARVTAIEEEGKRRHQLGRNNIIRGAGSPKGTSTGQYHAPSAALQAAGIREALEGTLIVPALDAPLRLIETTWPVMEVAAPVGSSSAPVRIDAIDPMTGQTVLTVANGVAPCQISLPVGQYRVVVGNAAAFAECSRTLIAPGVYQVVPQLVGTGVAQQGMVSVAVGTAVIGQREAGAIIYARQTIAHPGFLIDRTEVTCADYDAFCVATQAPLPQSWNDNYDPAWASLPVVGVSVDQARRYAEWRGKRLPTWAEWQIAARGPTGFVYPWGDDPEPLSRLSTIGRDRTLPWYAGVSVVGSTQLDTSWCGALDMFANADEWVDTPYVAQLDGVPFPVYPWRIHSAANWHTPRTSAVLNLAAVAPGPLEDAASGFRCAKSATP